MVLLPVVLVVGREDGEDVRGVCGDVDAEARREVEELGNVRDVGNGGGVVLDDRRLEVRGRGLGPLVTTVRGAETDEPIEIDRELCIAVTSVPIPPTPTPTELVVELSPNVLPPPSKLPGYAVVAVADIGIAGPPPTPPLLVSVPIPTSGAKYTDALKCPV